MYNEKNLIHCPECNALGLFSPNLFGDVVFHHKIASERVGYFTFTETHFDECARCGNNVYPPTHETIGCDR